MLLLLLLLLFFWQSVNRKEESQEETSHSCCCCCWAVCNLKTHEPNNLKFWHTWPRDDGNVYNCLGLIDAQQYPPSCTLHSPMPITHSHFGSQETTSALIGLKLMMKWGISCFKGRTDEGWEEKRREERNEWHPVSWVQTDRRTYLDNIIPT